MDDSKIMELCKDLINDVQRVTKDKKITKMEIMVIMSKSMKKYEPLYRDHHPLFNGILTKDVNLDNLYILKMMLEQRQKVKDGALEAENASKKVMSTLTEKYDFDLEDILANKK